MGSEPASADTVSDMPKWMRIAGWMFWQLLWLLLAVLVHVKLFSEYGALGGNRAIESTAAVTMVGVALWVGTWLPVRSGVFRR